jgi:hypothetical protein
MEAQCTLRDAGTEVVAYYVNELQASKVQSTALKPTQCSTELYPACSCAFPEFSAQYPDTFHGNAFLKLLFALSVRCRIHPLQD